MSSHLRRYCRGLTDKLPNVIVGSMQDEQLFDENGALSPGVHEFEWDEFSQLFGWNDWRRALLVGMLSALRHLKGIGCRRVYVNGSFTSTKEFPGDYDGCWERAGMDLRLLDPVFLDFGPGRKRQKAKYRGEWFPADAAANPAGTVFTQFFQTDHNGNTKGITAIDLGGLP